MNASTRHSNRTRLVVMVIRPHAQGDHESRCLNKTHLPIFLFSSLQLSHNLIQKTKGGSRSRSRFQGFLNSNRILQTSDNEIVLGSGCTCPINERHVRLTSYGQSAYSHGESSTPSAKAWAPNSCVTFKQYHKKGPAPIAPTFSKMEVHNNSSCTRLLEIAHDLWNKYQPYKACSTRIRSNKRHRGRQRT